MDACMGHQAKAKPKTDAHGRKGAVVETGQKNRKNQIKKKLDFIELLEYVLK